MQLRSDRLKPNELIHKYKALLTTDQCNGLEYYLSMSDTSMLVGRGIGINRRIVRIIRSDHLKQLETEISLNEYIQKLLEISANSILKNIQLECSNHELYSDICGSISRNLSFSDCVSYHPPRLIGLRAPTPILDQYGLPVAEASPEPVQLDAVN